MKSFFDDDNVKNNTYENKKIWVNQINCLNNRLNLDSHFDLDIRDKIGVLFGYAYRTKQPSIGLMPKKILIMILNIAYPPITVEYLKFMAITLNISYVMGNLQGIRYST